MTEDQFIQLQERLQDEFGSPTSWPMPLPRPKFWQLRLWLDELKFRNFFGNVLPGDRLTYWSEAQRPELMHEDVERLVLRCYRAMFRLPVHH